MLFLKADYVLQLTNINHASRTALRDHIYVFTHIRPLTNSSQRAYYQSPYCSCRYQSGLKKRLQNLGSNTQLK